jgi:hypothetical protein
MGNEIDFSFFDEWRNCQLHLGQVLVDEVLIHIAKTHGVYLFVNPTNPVSFAHFIRHDVQSKCFTIRERASRSGVQNGFICESLRYKRQPLKFYLGKDCYAAVRRAGIETLTKVVNEQDDIVSACCYDDGSYIVSDLDLICMAFKGRNDDQTFSDQEYGELTHKEKTTIEGINDLFQYHVNQHFPFQTPSTFKLISHGPYNRFSLSKASHIHFPLIVYTPAGAKLNLGIESDPESSLDVLGSFFNAIASEGYCIHLNPNWNMHRFDILKVPSCYDE